MRTEESEERVEDLMRIALHFIQNMKHPFSCSDNKYDKCCQ